MSVPAFPIPVGGLVVSCQAPRSSPMHGPVPMALMARAAVSGGAAGIRANGPADVAAIRATIEVPIIGINKIGDPTGVFITPSVSAAAEVVRAGADLVAIDGTARQRPGGGSVAAQIRAIHAELGVPVMADVDTVEAGYRARAAGADAVATTLAGHTGPGAPPTTPDLDLVAELAAGLDCPVIAEGGYETPAQVRAALQAGAYAIVVGTAITNPVALTRRLVGELRSIGV